MAKILQAIYELKGGQRFIFFDNEGKLKSTVTAIGKGGSKRAFIVNNQELPQEINGINIHDVAIILPNTDVDSHYGHWFAKENSMPYLETTISDFLIKHGLKTANQRLFKIYLFVDDKYVEIPCYVSDNFSKLPDKKLYVIDCKQLGDHQFFDRKYVELDIDDPRSLIKHFIEYEVPILYEIRWPRWGDCVNYAIDASDGENIKV